MPHLTSICLNHTQHKFVIAHDPNSQRALIRSIRKYNPVKINRAHIFQRKTHKSSFTDAPPKPSQLSHDEHNFLKTRALRKSCQA